MTLYYVKQFGLYYAGTDSDGTLKFTNVKREAVLKDSLESVNDLFELLGNVECEYEEKVVRV